MRIRISTTSHARIRISITSHVRICIRYCKSHVLCLSMQWNWRFIGYNHYHHSTKLYWKIYITRLLLLALLLMLCTRNNTDGNKLVTFSGIASYYGDNYIIQYMTHKQCYCLLGPLHHISWTCPVVKMVWNCWNGKMCIHRESLVSFLMWPWCNQNRTRVFRTEKQRFACCSTN